MKDLKKGFTLVELLAVIVILGLLMALTVPAIIKTIENGKKTAYDVIMTDIKSKAADYVNDNKAYVLDMLIKPIGSFAAFTLQELSDEGYLELPIVNPITGEEFDPALVRVKIKRETLDRIEYDVITDFLITDSDCFDFDPNTHIIYEYYYTNPLCSSDVVIPGTISGAAVTEIADDAFSFMGITSVVIPEGVTKVGNNSFSGNPLASLSLPSTLTYIERYAFWTGFLTSLNIPSSVTFIGYGAFNDNLLPDGQAFIYKRNPDGSNDYTNVRSYGGANRTNVIVPAGVTELDESSFESNSITNVTLPAGLLTMDNNCFYDNNFTSINIPNTVTTIGVSALGADHELQTLVLPPNLTYIGSWAFHDTNITNITIPSTVLFMGEYSLGISPLTSITMNRSNTTLQDNITSSLTNNFKIAYTAGGIGTYTGTRNGSWTKV